MIKPTCDKCGEELKAYGALAFSPPETLPDESCRRDVKKYHICSTCWAWFLDWLKPKPQIVLGSWERGLPPVTVVSPNARGMARELAAQDSESITDLNG